MKKICLLLFAGFFSLKSFSQTDFRFADYTAQWAISEYGWEFGGSVVHITTLFSVIGDTVINNLDYQIISNNTYDPISSAYVRKDSLGKVWTIFSNSFYYNTEFPLYDFGKLAGDTFNSIIFDRGVIHIRVAIDSVDSAFIAGKWRKRQFVHLGDNAWVGQCNNDTLIEGIGSTSYYLFGPVCNAITTDDGVYYLHCFHEQDFSFPDSCTLSETSIGIEDIEKSTKLSISPNPASSNFQLQLSSFPYQSISFKLFDAVGRKVKEETITNAVTTLQRGNLCNGIYFWQAETNGKVLDRGKIIFE